VGKAGLRVEVLATIPRRRVAHERTVEPAPLEGALGPIPGGVFLRAEGQDLGGGFEPKGVDQVEGKFVGVELEGDACELLDLLSRVV
jgi:hypothetical protein